MNELSRNKIDRVSSRISDNDRFRYFFNAKKHNNSATKIIVISGV